MNPDWLGQSLWQPRFPPPPPKSKGFQPAGEKFTAVVRYVHFNITAAYPSWQPILTLCQTSWLLAKLIK